MRWRSRFLLLSLLLVSFLIHVYRLERIPAGLDNDEVDKGYDAYALLRTGKDQWGKILPIYFKGFGDYRGELYTYSIVPSIALFGLTPFALRFPAVIFSLGTIIGTYLLGKRLYSKKNGLLAAFFLAFSPWFIGMTRVAIEAPVATFFMIVATLCFLFGLERRRWFIIAAILFSLTLYMYHAHRIVVPVFLFALFFIYRKKIKPFTKDLLGPFFLFIVCIIPLVFILFGQPGQRRIQQVLFTQDIGVVNRIIEQRVACERELTPWICKLSHNRVIDFTLVLVQNYISHFSLQPLFLTGFESTVFVIPAMGLFLVLELPFFFIGFFLLLRRRMPADVLCLSWLFLAPIPDSFTGAGHYHRFFIIFPAIQLMSAVGLNYVNKLRHLLSLGIVILVIGNIFLFTSKYFGSFRSLYSRRSHYEYIPLFRYLFSVENNYSAIYLSSAEYDTKQYIFYLFYSNYSPERFQNGIDVETVEEQGGWIRVKRIGKWHFLASLPDSGKIPENSLVIGGSNEFRSKRLINITKTQNLDGSEAFYLIRNCTAKEREEYYRQEKISELNGIIPQPIDCYY